MYTCLELVICKIDTIQQGTNFLQFKLRLSQLFQCVLTLPQVVDILLEREKILEFELDPLHIGFGYNHPSFPFRCTIIVIA